MGRCLISEDATVNAVRSIANGEDGANLEAVRARAAAPQLFDAGEFQLPQVAEEKRAKGHQRRAKHATPSAVLSTAGLGIGTRLSRVQKRAGAAKEGE